MNKIFKSVALATALIIALLPSQVFAANQTESVSVVVAPTTTFSVAPITPITLNVDPAVNTNQSAPITLNVATNASSYSVTVQESAQPISTSGSTLGYLSGSAGQASFITPGGSNLGFGYTMSGTGVPAGFASGTKYASFNTSPDVIMSGNAATNGDSSTMDVADYVDYTTQAGTYSTTLTFVITPTY